MRIVVGSTNPVKIEAVTAAFRKYYPSCEVVGLQVESGVSAQPRSEEEAIEGARARAKSALAMDEVAEFGVGLEGGVCELEGEMFECAWCAVSVRGQREGLGGGLYFALPPKVVKAIREGGELGPIMDRLTGEQDIKQKSGAIGVFTKGMLSRTEAYVHLVLSAMIKFVSPEWFV